MRIYDNKARTATKNKFEQLLADSHLESSKEPAEVANEIENAIFLNHPNIDNNYKSDFRRLLTSLKDRHTHFVQLLLDGKVEGSKFANMSVSVS